MKQITIDDLIPFMRKGWVCCTKHGNWMWFRKKPYIFGGYGIENFISRDVLDFAVFLPKCINIAPFDGDWKDSLIKVEHKEEE